MFVGLRPSLPLIRTGKLRPLAVTRACAFDLLAGSTHDDRSGVPDYEVTNWMGILASAATPPGLVRKLNGEVVRLLATPPVKERFAAFGVEPDSSTPEAFAEFLKDESARWEGVIRAAGLTQN